MARSESVDAYRQSVERFALAAAIRYPDLSDEAGLGAAHFRDEALGLASSVIGLCIGRTERGSVPVAEIVTRSGVSLEVMRQVLAADSPTPDQAREWWRRLIDQASTDALALAVRKIIDGERPEQDALADLLSRIESKLQEHATHAPEETSETIVAAATAYLDRKQVEIESGVTLGVRTGLSFVDSWIGGLNPGELTTLVAGGGVGKSTVAADLCRRVAERGHNSLYFSSEMTRFQVGQRVSHGAVAKPIGSDDFTMFDVTWARQEIRDHGYLSRIFMSYASGRTAGNVLSCARRIERKSGLSLVVFDHLGCFDSEKPRANEQEQVATTVQKVKDLAVLLNVPFLLLTHINRQGEIRASERVRDLSDNVLLLSRGKNDDCQKTYAKIVKARQTGENAGREMALQYSMKWQSFSELGEAHDRA